MLSELQYCLLNLLVELAVAKEWFLDVHTLD